MPDAPAPASSLDSTTAAGHVLIAEVVRSGFVEGHHHGSWVVLAADGSVQASAGDVTGPVLPRSCNKPLQALAMVEAGLGLVDEQLALACASHSGEPFHVEAVRRVLADAGLSEADLQTPVDWPLDDAARDEVIRAGGSKASVLMNCSGKHAAMLATCVANGWPTATYLQPDHPLQQQVLSTFARATGEQVQVLATDGCGAPLLSTSLTGLARGFASLATATEGPARRIAEAVRAHPAYVSGTTRDELALLTAIPGAIGKAGAESCYVVALPDGRAVATKTDDGGARARPVLMAALLERHGLLDGPGVDVDAVRRTGETPLLGGGHPVGEVRAVLP
ncbi:L-asparaginase II [Nocardioides scoriae]|uniref:L-asparaginase II n=1 Tax=Nocardioides scoriae TaxID=642780 RepID=A0A1H1X3J0_9ACTN|nr:asparaginase [Nocardioides scoriae]SDT03196.1 L-asparaginase II [Nocardioides scoriae]